MATPPSDDTRMMFKLLADGSWHDYNEIRDAIANAVPPGRALRRYEERVEDTRRFKGDPTYDTQAGEDERIFYGARACAQAVITSWKGRGVIYRTIGDRKQIRIKPGFKTWGVDVEPPDEPPETDVEALEQTMVAQQEAVAVMRGLLMAPDERAAEEAAEQVEAVIDLGFVSLPEEIQEEALAEVAEQPEAEPEPADVEEPKPVPVAESSETEVTAVDRNLLVEEIKSELLHELKPYLSTLLDEFQVGMEHYLNQQFDQVMTQFWHLRQGRGRWVFEPFKEP